MYVAQHFGYHLPNKRQNLTPLQNSSQLTDNNFSAAKTGSVKANLKTVYTAQLNGDAICGLRCHLRTEKDFHLLGSLRKNIFSIYSYIQRRRQT